MPSEAVPRATVAAVLAHGASRSPLLGGGRLVCVDGPAGSGKTTLAAAVAAAAGGARVVHMDDLYEGWSGLPGIADQLEGILRPLAAGAPGRYRRYDWDSGRFAEWHEVRPSPLLVLEGVGSGALRVADLVSTLVFVDAPYDLRLRRGLERDGEAFAPHWRAWARAEAELLAAERTRERADLYVDAHGRLDPS